MKIYEPHTIKWVRLREDGRLEVVRQYASHMVYATNPPRSAPDKVIKEIYGVRNGKIVLEEEIRGTHEPSYIVEEQIKFEDENDN